MRKKDVYLEFQMYCKVNVEEGVSKAHFLKIWKQHCRYIKWCVNISLTILLSVNI